MFFVFADLEKTFNQVPKGSFCFAWRHEGDPEYLLNGVMWLCEGCKTAVSVEGQLSDSLPVKVDVY